MTNVTLDGFEELRAKLASFNLKEEVTNDALEKAGEHLRQAVTNSVPVRTGALKKSITKGKVVEGKILVGPSQLSPGYRAHFVEFGTSKMPARPFMRPAFEQEKSTIEKIMADEIRKGLKL